MTKLCRGVWLKLREKGETWCGAICMCDAEPLATYFPVARVADPLSS